MLPRDIVTVPGAYFAAQNERSPLEEAKQDAKEWMTRYRIENELAEKLREEIKGLLRERDVNSTQLRTNDRERDRAQRLSRTLARVLMEVLDIGDSDDR